MLKRRIIPCLLFKDWGIVKSVQFNELRRVGDPTTCARVFNSRNADELIFLDIMAGREKKEPNFAVIEEIAHECFMPLTIGGGIRTMAHVEELFRIGADKVALNSPVVTNPDFLNQIATKYGSQALVVSIDAKKVGNGHKAFINSGQKETEFTPEQLAIRAESYGAGEIFLNSIDNDGVMEGYDIKLIKRVTSAVSIPLIAAGGCGSLQDFVTAIKDGNADAVSAASIFYFVGESIITTKKRMHQEGINVRLV